MSSYHTSFKYLNKNSNTDFSMNILSFDPDNGSQDTFLGMDSVFTENYDGTKRYDYSAKYNSVASIVISLVKNNYEDLSTIELRALYKWLSGAKNSSWLDLYNGDNIDYSFLGKFTKIEAYKLDARTIGVTVTFESVSPWAYSPIQTETIQVDGTISKTINNLSDDLYTYVYPKIVYTNTSNAVSGTSDFFSILNAATQDTTKLTGIVSNEVVTMDSNQIIYSNVNAKLYGDNFNMKWFKLVSGNNVLTINGVGTMVITYRYPIKIGDCAIDLN